ncbi:MAG: HAD-IA family hydrolase [Anaerolineaceae bacterium]|nr:HAD-IA family hydrolase [Betaproteobacteria bacterium]
MIRFDAIVFDFDGVLVESVNVKTQAFAALYSGYGDFIVEQVVAFHLANGGLSRFEKFRYFHNKLLGLPLSLEEENRLAADFNARVEAAVIAAPWVDGAEEFLAKYYTNIPLFVASGTPEEELKRILEKRHISHYFRAVFGSPAKKGAILRGILENGGYRPEKMLMIGDSLLDMEGAKEAGACFLGRLAQPDNGFPPDVPTLPDMIGLQKFVHEN